MLVTTVSRWIFYYTSWHFSAKLLSVTLFRFCFKIQYNKFNTKLFYSLQFGIKLPCSTRYTHLFCQVYVKVRSNVRICVKTIHLGKYLKSKRLNDWFKVDLKFDSNLTILNKAKGINISIFLKYSKKCLNHRSFFFL